MVGIFNVLEETMNKSAISNFRQFLQKYSGVNKWILVSDYCLDDKNKSNNVVSFVFFPYIIDINEWQSLLQDMQKTDLKKTRSVSNQFSQFLNERFIFSFNFILEKANIFESLNNKEILLLLLNQYIEATEKWQNTTPNNRDIYKDMNKRLKKVLHETKNKAFNYKLLSTIFMVTFLASYLKYLLLKEQKDITLYSWLSDIDAITTWQEGIYRDIYHITEHSLCTQQLGYKTVNQVKELHPAKGNNKIFHEQLNRVADFICGGLADFDYKAGKVTAKKHCDIIENIISDNEDIIILSIHANGMARVVHTSPPLTDI